MATRIYRVNKPDEYRQAGPDDLIALLPAPGENPLFMVKWVMEILVAGIALYEFIHLSGPTGSAKSSLLEALHLVPGNFQGICKGLGIEDRPLRIYPVEMATFETPGEFYYRRSLKNGTTFDEKSTFVAALEDASKQNGDVYPLIWLREIGRVHSSNVLGGLLNLMTKGDIVLPDGSRIDGRKIARVADSNYQAEQDSAHNLIAMDDALKRRFSVNLTLEYLSPEQEFQALQHILKKENE